MITLANVASSAAAAIGCAGFDDDIDLGRTQHVVIVLVDGLGSRSLDEHSALAPVLSSQQSPSIATVFPSTTPAGLGSLGTGELPGVHGIIGTSFIDPDTDRLVTPLHWQDEPHPIGFQPNPTVFERVERAGFPVSTVSIHDYASTGLTRAVLRGGDYVVASSVSDVIGQISARTTQPGLTYVYWPELDRHGHSSGVGSSQWSAELQRVDRFIEELLDSVGRRAAVVVTADHGMINCSLEDRIDIDADVSLTAGVRHLCGEPRARFVYAEPGAAADVHATWTEQLAGRAMVFAAADRSDLFGPIDPDIEDRLPDVIAVSSGTTNLYSEKTDARLSSFIGQHGALTDAERYIPCVVFRCE